MTASRTGITVQETVRMEEERGWGGNGREREGNAALIICTRTSLLSCGGRTRPLQLWHSALPSCFHSLRPPLRPPPLESGYFAERSSLPTPLPLVLPPFLLACSFLRGYRARAESPPFALRILITIAIITLPPSRKKVSLAILTSARQLSPRSFFRCFYER